MGSNKNNGVRGNGRLAKRLNAPLKGKLARKTSLMTKFVIFGIVFVFIALIAIKHLGLETGLYFTLTVILLSLIFGFLSWHDVLKREKIMRKKRPWREFD